MQNNEFNEVIKSTMTLLVRHESGGDAQHNEGHRKKHFANVYYGYWVLMISFLYLIFIYAIRKMPNRPSVSSLHAHILNKIYRLDPMVHLLIIFIPVCLTIPTHYSFVQNFGLYAKRIGRMSYVLVTLNLVISLKPPVFLYKQDYTYDEFIPLHKWLSRIIFLIAIVHGLAFLFKWSSDQAVSLIEKCSNIQNFIGVFIVFWMLVLIAISFGRMRRRNYVLFYVGHQLINLLFIFGTPLHARPGVTSPYFWLNFILLTIHGINRLVVSQVVKIHSIVKNTNSQNSNLLAIIRLSRNAAPTVYPPGTHIRISPYGRFNPLYWLFPSHPYTICSAPEEAEVSLIVSESNFRMMTEKAYTIVGSYPSILPNALIEDIGQQILIVCGGSGIGYGLSLFEYFKHNTNVDYLKLIWLLKDPSDLEFIRVNFGLPDLKIGENLEVYVTGNNNSETTSSSNVNEESFEMQTTLHTRRINWNEDLNDYIERKNDKSWMICCGPKSLINDACDYATQNDINFISEYYSI
ncbi:similar to Saccharomyces cerevisiae YGL160W AIM14 Protein with similarity to iron/copper reductases (FRE1-8), possibly involved in iron homeostasis [Maudiozyma saulgeensis]|uniref:Probable metalloreductase AIM14 n=1 Tax=Maudiozyma saulgeensis TaxID=1789683 RepID=A0A1X7R0R5_9SACH|nr:similar to Saccharomyces cerevisiae YGL160W AIM14 Protein with similarity to iron/copper reductases (FRE1-8), possibly involved in iron homeostasis [Kazachstania saulgeensis]